jgi:hypothetical protein
MICGETENIITLLYFNFSLWNYLFRNNAGVRGLQVTIQSAIKVLIIEISLQYFSLSELSVTNLDMLLKIFRIQIILMLGLMLSLHLLKRKFMN